MCIRDRAIGEPSHFNQSHSILAPVYFLMGVFAAIGTSLSLVTGIGVLRNTRTSLSLPLKYCVGYGLIITFILTMITAGYMSGAPAQAHAVLPAGATTASGTLSVPLLGWLREVGDLRVAHFFATHALHGVPLTGWLLVRFLPQDQLSGNSAARTTALALSGGYCVLVVALFIQALNGMAFIR